MWLDSVWYEYDVISDDWFNWCRGEERDAYKEHRNYLVFMGLEDFFFFTESSDSRKKALILSRSPGKTFNFFGASGHLSTSLSVYPALLWCFSLSEHMLLYKRFYTACRYVPLQHKETNNSHDILNLNSIVEI